MSQIMFQPSEVLHIEMIETDDGFDSIESDWRRLYNLSTFKTTPLKWEWMREWWRTFGTACSSPHGKLQLLAVRKERTIIAILPLYLKSHRLLGCRQLRMLSTGEQQGETTYPEYLSLLFEPSYEDEIVSIISREIFQHMKGEWDQLLLGIVNSNSPLTRLDRVATQPFSSSRITHCSYQATLEKGFSEYFSRLTNSSGQTLKRILKQKSRADLLFSAANSVEQAIEYFSELVMLHQHRWKTAGMMGAFSSRRSIQFHHAIIRKLFVRNEVLLCRLAFQNKPVAIIYGFLNHNRFEFYQSGVDREQTLVKSAGILAHLLAIEYLCEMGITVYDFLSGESSYKKTLASAQTIATDITYHQRSLRSAIAGLGGTIERIRVRFQRVLQ